MHYYLLELGLNNKEATATLDSLLLAERAGISSHGLNRIFSGFIHGLLHDHRVEPNREPILLAEGASSLSFDGNFALGYYAIWPIVQRVLAKLESTDVVICHAKNLYPTNCLFEYAAFLCDLGIASFLSSKSPDRIVPPIPFESQPTTAHSVAGTNAQSWAFPGSNGRHIIFDATMAASSNGKVIKLHQGPAEDFDRQAFLSPSNGTPSTPAELFDDEGRFVGKILPFGGPSGHKGFGSLVVGEMLNLLQPDNHLGLSTTLIAFRIEDREFIGRVEAYRTRVRHSLKRGDTSMARLPYERAHGSISNTTEDEVFRRYESMIADLPSADLRSPILLQPTLFAMESHTRISALYQRPETCIPEAPIRLIQRRHRSFREDVLRSVIDIVTETYSLPMSKREITEYAFAPTRDDAAFFDIWAQEDYDLRHLQSHKDLLAKLVAEQHFTANDDLLDVGCGSGALLQHVPQAKSVTCLDVSSEMLELLRRSSNTLPYATHFIHGDLRDVSLSGSFSKIYAVLSLHHLPHSQKSTALSKLNGLLAPEGTLAIAETFLDSMRLSCLQSVTNIANVYLAKIHNCIRNHHTSHAIKEIQILRRILFEDGEYMLTMNQWTHLLEAASFRVTKRRITDRARSYGYILATTQKGIAFLDEAANVS